MANRYWVTGGTGNWNSTTNWSTASGGASGASVPSSSDAALFDASSGSGTATLDISPTIQTLTCTGFTGTLAFGTNTITLNSTGTIFTGATTMTVTGTPLIICTNPGAATKTINPGLVSEANTISFRISAGTGSFNMISANSNVKDLDFTDGVNPTGFTGSFTATFINVYGNFKASTGMTQNPGTGSITFAATSGTKTIITAGVTFDRPFNFNGVGGTWQLQDALTSGATRTCTLTAGALDLNNNSITIGQFSSSNTNVRSVKFDNAVITLTSASTTANTTIFTTSDPTNLSFSGSRSFIVSGAPTAFIRTISGALVSSGGTESHACNFIITAGSDTISFGSVSRVYRKIQFNSGFTGSIGTDSAPFIYGNLELSSGMSVAAGTNNWVFKATSGTFRITTNNVTINNPITFDGIGGIWEVIGALTLDSASTLTLTNGTVKFTDGTTNTVGSFATSGSNQKYLQSITSGTQATLSAASGTINATYLTIQDSNATGGATWNALYDYGNINAGNNSGWYFGDSPTVGNEITMRLRSFTQPRRF